jgi:hypothetical protein
MKFPNVHAFKAPREMSDHCPLFLCRHSSSVNKKREFRFELAWLKDAEFLSKVQEIWENHVRDVIALDKVLFKLRKVMRLIKGWGFNRAGNKKLKKGYKCGIKEA